MAGLCENSSTGKILGESVTEKFYEKIPKKLLTV